MAEVDWTQATWRKSTWSDAGSQCLEVAMAEDAVGVRHSKDPASPMLVFETDAWRAFIAALKRGDFDRLAGPA